MSKNIIKSGYGLLHKKSNKLVGFEVESNEGGYACGENTYKLSLSSENIWIVKDKFTASYVRINNTPYYNSKYETPVMDIGNPEEFDVVKIEMSASIETPDRVPTFEEYMNLKHNRPGKKHYDPEHYKLHIKNYRNGVTYAPISLYDIEKLLKEIKDEPIDKSKWGVHEEHCCAKHGCKYGDKNCPVVIGLTKQHYPCEDCD